MERTIRIGYVPYSTNLTHPDDRRRFPFFAKRQNLEYVIADTEKKFDIIILPAPANLSRWLEYKKRNPETKFIFEMVDSLTYQKDFFNIFFKGIGRYIIKKEDKPYLIHRNLLIKWLRVADTVICSNPKVRNEIKHWNDNVVLSLDYLEHEYHYLKSDYSIEGKMKLFWEGQGVVLPQLLSYWDVFRAVSSYCELHIVSENSYPRLGQFFSRKTESLLRELPIETHFHQWNLTTNANLFKTFDCGIIPIDKNDSYGWHKPANKLISFWFSGIPTLASNTPAYKDVASKSDIDFICASPAEWVQKIRKMKEATSQARYKMAQKNYKTASDFYSNEMHDQFWTNLLENTRHSLPGKERSVIPPSLKKAV